MLIENLTIDLNFIMLIENLTIDLNFLLTSCHLTSLNGYGVVIPTTITWMSLEYVFISKTLKK